MERRGPEIDLLPRLDDPVRRLAQVLLELRGVHASQLARCCSVAEITRTDAHHNLSEQSANR